MNIYIYICMYIHIYMAVGHLIKVGAGRKNKIAVASRKQAELVLSKAKPSHAGTERS